MSSPITAKTLQVHVEETDGNDTTHHSSFKAYEFDNGVIMVPGSQINDWFFVNRDSIEAGALASCVVRVTETEDTMTFTQEELSKSIAGSIGEFGEDEGTRKASCIMK